MKTIYKIILGMCLVTYVPRMLPAVLMERIPVQGKLEKFLRMVPYAAMGTLIFPGILSVDSSRPYIGMLGGAIAAYLSYKKKNMTIVIIASIVVVGVIRYLFLHF